MPRWIAWFPVQLASIALAACTGVIDSPAPGGWDAQSGGFQPGIASPNGAPLSRVSPGVGTAASGGKQGAPSAGGFACGAPAVGPAPLRRLTHAEYDNAVADLLGDTSRPAREFAQDTEVGIFDNTAAAQTVPVLLAEQYLTAAEALARAADVPALLGCDAASATCVRSFVRSFGRRAYRRPLTAAEIERYASLHTSTAKASDAVTGVRAVLAGMLSAPNFLFKLEYGEAASKTSTIKGAKHLDQFELATRLASLLWSSIPDDALLDAAEGGELATADQVSAQARRMLADPKAVPALRAFYARWLGLPLLDSVTKDPTAYPAWSEQLRAAMRAETEHFIDYVLWEDDARLSTLLTADYSVLNGSLAKLYGVTSPGSSDAYVRTPLDPRQRSGVLTQPSLMAAFGSPASSSPIKRGKLVRVRLLCQDLMDPPPNVPPPPEPKEGVSTRERFAMHTDSPACSGCHNLIDGIGFGLEHYDGIGSYRTVDHGVPVDSSGEMNATIDIDGPYYGGPELAGKLAKSVQMRDCVPTQWLRYALARRETPEDACSLEALQRAFADSDGDLQELMVALTRTDVFLNYRAPE